LEPAAAADVESAVGEALANTVEHSGASAFRIRCCCDDHGLIVEIQDNGSGFHHERHCQPLREPTLDAIRGFGLLLMHRLMDEVSFADNGRLIRLQKYWSVQQSNERTG
jgi:anti-sigma regulatory factor (Ser/Thr protein kinase)